MGDGPRMKMSRQLGKGNQKGKGREREREREGIGYRRRRLVERTKGDTSDRVNYRER